MKKWVHQGNLSVTSGSTLSPHFSFVFGLHSDLGSVDFWVHPYPTVCSRLKGPQAIYFFISLLRYTTQGESRIYFPQKATDIKRNSLEVEGNQCIQ